MSQTFEHNHGDEMTIEQVIVYGLSDSINFIARDEDGELWATKDEPTVEKDSEGREFVAFPLTGEIDDMHSLSAFEHLFTELTPLSIVELEKEKGE